LVDLGDDEEYYVYDDEDPYISRSQHVTGLPGGTSGITGRVPRYYRDILKQIYDKFWIKEFTCVDVRKIPGLKKFKCQQLRMFSNYGVVSSTVKRMVRGQKPLRVWKITGEAANYFAERT
jgi:hypothetical protein